MQAALRLRALVAPKPSDDPDWQFDGALMLAELCLDIHILRIGIFKE